jgi:hypothetical protein
MFKFLRKSYFSSPIDVWDPELALNLSNSLVLLSVIKNQKPIVVKTLHGACTRAFHAALPFTQAHTHTHFPAIM